MESDKPSIDAIFMAAIERPVEARAAYLDEVCGNDRELKSRIVRLLDAQPKAADFLESPAAELGATVDQPITEKPGTQIGPYKLLQQIGEGGFGVVYMAEQIEPVKRRVALKIIKPGMDTHEVVARFEAERQALALMDHPNIAKILDAGTTDTGRPYFVMELVRGVPITDYCDKNDLPTEARLRLLSATCQAIHHAHQKGVIHRDLKPSNIMVTLHDGKPVVKIIDFGVSKAINQRLTERTLFTAYGQMVGTPQYMSPEQAEMSGLDIDTRSDIYSLGVVLYELLTGYTPFDAERLRDAGFAEMQRIIQEEDPLKPSIRLSSAGEQLTVIAKHRGIEPRRLRQLMQGELDWIVMKSLEKERDRRYGSAAAFADDIGHFLGGEAVRACPPSNIYLLRKFVRRNRVAALVGVAVSVSLVIACVSFGWGMLRARDELAARADHERAQRMFVLESARLILGANHPTRADQLLATSMEDWKDDEFNRHCRNLRKKCQVSLQSPTVSTLTPLCVAMSPTDDLIAFGTAAFMVDVLRLPNGTRHQTLRRPSAWVRCVRFSPDGQLLAAGSSDSTVRLWDVKSGELLHSIGLNAKARSIAFSPDGGTLAVGDYNGQLTLLNVEDGESVCELVEDIGERPDQRADVPNSTEPNSIWHIEFAPDGSTVAAGDYRTTTVWNIEDHSQLYRISGFHRVSWSPREQDCSPVPHFTYSPDSVNLACWRLGESRDMVLLDAETGTRKVRFVESKDIYVARFSSGGDFLAASCPDGTVRIWLIETGELLNSLHSPNQSSLFGLAISPDDQWIATGGDDNVVRLWDAHTGEEVDQFYGHSETVGCLMFSHDGRFLISWVMESAARVWSLQE
jgi:serine/threonine protein kinase/WD40 repeat protein